MRSAILVVALASTAHAQPGAQPPMAPPPGPAAPAPAAPPDSVDVMADRWAVNLSLWFGSMTPHADGAVAIPLAGLELSGRWRIREPIELAFSLFGGGSGDPNNNDMNTVSIGGFMVDARWRFLYDRPWNIAAVAGLGVISAAAKAGATDTDKQGRGSLRVGAAVERRFEHWAIEADFRIFAVQKNDSVVLLDQPTPRTFDAARYGLTGAYLTIGANYYF